MRGNIKSIIEPASVISEKYETINFQYAFSDSEFRASNGLSPTRDIIDVAEDHLRSGALKEIHRITSKGIDVFLDKTEPWTYPEYVKKSREFQGNVYYTLMTTFSIRVEDIYKHKLIDGLDKYSLRDAVDTAHERVQEFIKRNSRKYLVK